MVRSRAVSAPVSSKRHYVILAGIWLTLLVFIFAAAANGIKLIKLTRDPGQTEDHPIYIGFLSDLGALAWCSAGTACLFACWLSRSRGDLGVRSQFLLYMGILSWALLIDDFFMFHERVAPEYLNIPSDATQAIFPVLILGLLIRYGRFIYESTPYALLATSLAMLAGSLALDGSIIPGGTDVEDGIKVMGIAAYTYYCVLTSGILASSPIASRST